MDILRGLFIILLISMFLPSTAQEAQRSVPQSMESMVSAVEVAGYRRFAHAIRTSNISGRITSSRGLTFFAPTDEALDGRSDFSLEYHVATDDVLAFQALVDLPVGTRLQTLCGNRSILLTDSQGDHQSVCVDDVQISVPDLYFDGLAAVHGLDCLLMPTLYNNANSADHRGFPYVALPSPPAKPKSAPTPTPGHPFGSIPTPPSINPKLGFPLPPPPHSTFDSQHHHHPHHPHHHHPHHRHTTPANHTDRNIAQTNSAGKPLNGDIKEE